jgi:N-methylhydantoinase B
LKNGRVDKKATAALRVRMARERGAVALFDRGFASIDELKARCEQETGLPPPAAPRFSAFARARKRTGPAEGKQRRRA